MSLPIPRFRDGPAFDHKNFEFLDKFRRVTLAEKRGTILAWSICGETEGYSIALVRGEGVFAQALSYPTFDPMLEAITRARESQFRSSDRFLRNIVAVLNFAPNFMEANSISATGADAIFAPNHTGPDGSDLEKALRFNWYGDSAQHRDEGEKRALIRPRYLLIRVKGEGDDVLEQTRIKREKRAP